MNLRSSLACTSSDIARWGLRSVLKRQGGVLPGRIAMKIDPELLSDLASLVDRSVVITGTNGKTTTSNPSPTPLPPAAPPWYATAPATIWSLVWWVLCSRPAAALSVSTAASA